MRRALLVTYYFPPEPVAGALRPRFLAAHLPEFGWNVTVLTRPLGAAPGVGYQIVTAEVLGAPIEQRIRKALEDVNHEPAPRPSRIRRALRWAKEAFSFPDRNAGWLFPAIGVGLALSRRQRLHAIISTAYPPTVHVVAAAIAKCQGLPWIADYRDLWTGNPYFRRSRFRVSLERGFERMLIRRASAVTTVSNAIAASLGSLHHRDVSVIPNACNLADWLPLQVIRPHRFELCYTGSMYDGRRSPKLLFEALAQLRDRNDAAADARIVFFGTNCDFVDELARHFGVADLVERHAAIPRSQALCAQRRASDLLIFLSMDEATSSELGSKILEYVGSRRPILAFGPRSSALREYIEGHRLGWFASDVPEATAALRDAYRRYKAGDLEVESNPNIVLHPRDLARAFALRLDAIQHQE